MDTVENRALVGLTLLSDVCDIENKNAKLYLDALYSHKYDGYIKYLIQGVSDEDNYKFGVPRFDRNFVDFKFSPVVNSNLRFNKGEEVVRFFLRQGELDKSCQQRQKTLVNEILSKADVVELSHFASTFELDCGKDCTYRKSDDRCSEEGNEFADAACYLSH